MRMRFQPLNGKPSACSCVSHVLYMFCLAHWAFMSSSWLPLRPGAQPAHTLITPMKSMTVCSFFVFDVAIHRTCFTKIVPCFFDRFVSICHALHIWALIGLILKDLTDWMAVHNQYFCFCCFPSWFRHQQQLLANYLHVSLTEVASRLCGLRIWSWLRLVILFFVLLLSQLFMKLNNNFLQIISHSSLTEVASILCGLHLGLQPITKRDVEASVHYICSSSKLLIAASRNRYWVKRNSISSTKVLGINMNRLYVCGGGGGELLFHLALKLSTTSFPNFHSFLVGRFFNTLCLSSSSSTSFQRGFWIKSVFISNCWLVNNCKSPESQLAHLASDELILSTNFQQEVFELKGSSFQTVGQSKIVNPLNPTSLHSCLNWGVEERLS